MATKAPNDIWETIAREATRESELWEAALLAPDERELVRVFSPLADERFALGLETIYEGYLLHYGRSRLFASPDRDARVLLGDYLYAHGLVRIADFGEAGVVADLAELLSLCAQVRAEADSRGDSADGVAWAATVALLGSGDPELDEARAALREQGDPAPLAHLAEQEAGGDDCRRALALHRRLVAH